MTWPSLPPLPGIDYTEAFRRLGHKPQLLLKLLYDFRNNFALTAHRLEEHAETGDWSSVKDLLHTLKGVAGYIGARDLGQDASRLEETIIHKKYDQTGVMLHSLTKRLNKLFKAMELLPARPEKVSIDDAEVESATFNPREVEEKLQSLMQQLQQGELISEQLIYEIKSLAQTPEISSSLHDIIEFIEDIEYDTAANRVARLLAGLQRDRGDTEL